MLNDLTLSDKGKTMAITAYSDIFYQSQGLSNDFMNKFIFGGHIDKELKKKVEKQLQDEGNRLGIGWSTGLKFYDLRDSVFKNTDWSYAVNFEHHTLANSSFTRDLFHGVFIGNADRVGLDLKMGPSSFNTVTFQELGYSFVYKPKGCEFGISLIKGQSHQAMEASKMTLNTSSDVSTITLDANATMHLTDSARTKISTLNGVGLGLNAIYYIPIRTVSEGSSSLEQEAEKVEIGTIRIEVDNLGFVSWNRNPEIYRVDSLYSFSGYEIQNIFDQDYSNWFNEEELKDSLLPKAESSTYYTLLPAVFSVSFMPNMANGKKMNALVGARYQLNANYRPLVYGGLVYSINEHFNTSLLGIVGGYGEITAGLRVRYSGKSVGAYISSNNVIGMLSPNGYGKNLNLGMVCRF